MSTSNDAVGDSMYLTREYYHFSTDRVIHLLCAFCTIILLCTCSVIVFAHFEMAEMSDQLSTNTYEFKFLTEKTWRELDGLSAELIKYGATAAGRNKRHVSLSSSYAVAPSVAKQISCPSGPPGPKGLPGTPGAPGPDGRPGNPGTDGEAYVFEPVKPPCIRCPVGPPGFRGEPGAVGEPGLDGQDGRDGENGQDGNPGPAGSPGNVGNQGPIGNQGEIGEPGLDAHRPVGIKGMPGSPGPSGPVGPPGEKGDFGEDGPAGPQGAIGSPGVPGDNGLPGIPGKDGNNGKDGIDMDYCKCPERVSITEALKYQREHSLPSLPFSQSTNIGSAAPSSGREVPASLLVGEGTSKDYSNEIVNEEEEPTIIINKAADKLRSGQVRIKKQKVQKS